MAGGGWKEHGQSPVFCLPGKRLGESGCVNRFQQNKTRNRKHLQCPQSRSSHAVYQSLLELKQEASERENDLRLANPLLPRYVSEGQQHPVLSLQMLGSGGQRWTIWSNVQVVSIQWGAQLWSVTSGPGVLWSSNVS